MSPRAHPRAALALAVTLAALAAAAPPLRAQADAGREALRAGRYDEAVDRYGEALRTDAGNVAARTGLIEALLARGRYEDAIRAGREAPDPDAVANATGEALLRAGRLAEAEEAFRRAAARGDAWSLVAEANLAETLFLRGRAEEAMQRFDAFIDVYNRSGGRLGARDLVAVGRALRYLGRARSELFQDALRAYDEAARADPGWAEPIVRAGDLFLEKYSSPEAKAEYERVLSSNPRHPGALLGMARALEFDGTAGAAEYLDRLFQVDPAHPAGRALRALQHLTRGDTERAREEVDRALSAAPDALPALSALAAIHFVERDAAAFERVRGRVLELAPAYAELDATLAELAVRTRRYEDAVERARAAVELDPSHWEAWGLLGLNQLRVGAIEEGRSSLERAFAGDPYNPWFKNSLDLLDTFAGYEVHETEHFELFLHGDEAELLATYLAPLAEEAYDALARRYGVEPETPVRAELFPRHADFSVRALGEAGLGALGVSFGSVLVMDAPSARTLGEYNWASVFWHELAHTFHLAATDHRVPRWFSEGLAVHEQRQARPGWGHQPTVGFVQALRDGRLEPVSRLDDGFMRPDYPEQVVFSYYQASLVFRMIEERWGFDAIRRMLDGYRDGRATPEVVQSVLGMDEETLDAEFDRYLRLHFRNALRGLSTGAAQPGRDAGAAELEALVQRHPDDFLLRLRAGARQLEDGHLDEAQRHAEAATTLFPDYGGPGGPWALLARIHRERGDLEAAADALRHQAALSEASYEIRLELAEVLRSLGRPGEAADALQEAVQIWPYDLELHRRLADLRAERGDHAAEVLERRAVVALRPTDMARALYRLALAEQRAGDREAARRSVIRALEVAPNYEEALELLLELRGGGRR